MRLEAGRRGRCSFWLAGSCGHWANTARPLRPKGPPLRGRHRGEKQRGEGDAQTGVTEQTAQIKMENQEQAGPPGSPGQEWRLGRAKGGGGVPSVSPGVLNFQGPPTPEEGPEWAETGGAEQGRPG